MDNSDLFIGASIEDIETGLLSGSVYVTPSPPIIKLVSPLCTSAENIDLFGYPFGGTWSGPGIINATEGTFDPKIAGMGIHELRYITSSCLYEGILRIEVEVPPVAQLITTTFLQVCKNKSFSVNLEVAPEDGVNYLWYFRADPNLPLASLDIRSATMLATARGEYQLKAYKKACAVYTPLITIADEELEVVIASPPETCERNSTPVELMAEPSGGTWTGTGIANSQFFATNLTVGIYKATYTYVSALGCQYAKDVDLIVTHPPLLEIEIASPFITCERNSTPIQLVANPSGGTWAGPGIADGQFVSANLTNGVYKATYAYVSPIGCPYVKDVELIVIPAPVPIIKRIQGNLCKEGLVTLAVDDPVPGTNYTWSFWDESNSDMVLGNGARIDIDKRGSYSVSADYNACLMNSLPTIINDDQLKAMIEPVRNFTQICAGEKFNIVVKEPLDATFTWQFSPSPSGPMALLQNSDNTLQVVQSGYYQVSVSKGACTFESDLKQILIRADDYIIVPNVFTPNGDGHNEVFKIEGTATNGTMLILNRYGSLVFEGSAVQGWTGGNASAGVYFWLVQYPGCDQEQKVMKGIVQLIR